MDVDKNIFWIFLWTHKHALCLMKRQCTHLVTVHAQINYLICAVGTPQKNSFLSEWTVQQHKQEYIKTCETWTSSTACVSLNCCTVKTKNNKNGQRWRSQFVHEFQTGLGNWSSSWLKHYKHSQTRNKCKNKSSAWSISHLFI